MKHLISATIVFALLGSTVAIAQRDTPNSQSRDQRQNNDGRQWSRGDQVSNQYRQNQYFVNDWQQHYLRTPPRGYRWVRNDNDQYLLISIRTGMIADVVSQNQYRNDYRWSQGDRLSGGYMENRYVVSDWRGNHLRRPGPGQHWVRVNNQFMLTANGSGVIIEIDSNRR